MGQLVSDVTDVLNYQKSKKTAANTRQQILQQMAQDEQAKTNLVKKALSQQRANFGAAGVNASSTSAGAVLKRLRNETEAPYQDKKENNLTKLKNVQTKKVNLLKKLITNIDKIVK